MNTKHSQAIAAYQTAQFAALDLPPKNIFTVAPPQDAPAPRLYAKNDGYNSVLEVAALSYAHAIKLARSLRSIPAIVAIGDEEFSVAATPLMETESFESATRIYRRTFTVRYSISKIENE